MPLLWQFTEQKKVNLKIEPVNQRKSKKETKREEIWNR
jgi:hypothetical protein